MVRLMLFLLIFSLVSTIASTATSSVAKKTKLHQVSANKNSPNATSDKANQTPVNQKDTSNLHQTPANSIDTSVKALAGANHTDTSVASSSSNLLSTLLSNKGLIATFFGQSNVLSSLIGSDSLISLISGRRLSGDLGLLPVLFGTNNGQSRDIVFTLLDLAKNLVMDYFFQGFSKSLFSPFNSFFSFQPAKRQRISSNHIPTSSSKLVRKEDSGIRHSGVSSLLNGLATVTVLAGGYYLLVVNGPTPVVRARALTGTPSRFQVKLLGDPVTAMPVVMIEVMRGFYKDYNSSDVICQRRTICEFTQRIPQLKWITRILKFITRYVGKLLLHPFL